MKKRLLASAVSVAGMMMAGYASAQLAPEPTNKAVNESGVLEVVVVTAEKREATAQSLAATIDVLSGREVTESGITDVVGLQRLTTGMQIGEAGAATQIFIRGIGSFAANSQSVPGIAFTVDGVYVGRAEATGGNFYDLARIEVLKGPQGTLYGRNATGGAINLITNAPELGVSSVDLNFEGGNYDLVHVSGAGNVPIGQDMALRGAFNVVYRDGYLSDGTNDDEEQSARLRFLYDAGGDISLLLNADYTNLGGKGGDYVYSPQYPGGDPWDASTSQVANDYMHNFAPPTSAIISDQLPNNFLDGTLYNFSAQMDWELPFATLTVIPAYRYSKTETLFHFTTQLTNEFEFEQTTFEARLSNSNDWLEWVVGGYYFDEKAEKAVNQVFATPFLLNSITYNYPKTTSGAAFGQATVSITDNLRLIGGARYTYEETSLDGESYSRVTDPFTLTQAYDADTSDNDTSYKVGFEYDVTDQNMLYATYSTGYKAGGFSPAAPPIEYKPETLDAFEIGMKNVFLENRLQFNVSGFYWEYQDIQDSRPAYSSDGTLNLTTFNSGDATIKGGNVEIVAVPTSRDTVSLSIEYADSEYDKFAYTTPGPFFNTAASGCASSGPYAPGESFPVEAGGKKTNTGPLPVYLTDCEGFQVARLPEWSGTFAYSHDFNLSNGAVTTFNTSLTYADARWIAIDFIPAERDNAYLLVDANLTYYAPGENWSVGLFGRNLTEQAYFTGGIESGLIAGLVSANIGPPRTYGVQASIHF